MAFDSNVFPNGGTAAYEDQQYDIGEKPTVILLYFCFAWFRF